MQCWSRRNQQTPWAENAFTIVLIDFVERREKKHRCGTTIVSTLNKCDDQQHRADATDAVKESQIVSTMRSGGSEK